MSVKAHRRRRGSRERKFNNGQGLDELEREAPVVVRHDPSIILPEKWWWTLSKRESECHDCENAIEDGEVIAFGSRKTVLCTACAFERGIEDQCEESRAFRLMAGLP